MRIAHIDTVYGNMCIDTVFGDRLYVSGGWVDWVLTSHVKGLGVGLGGLRSRPESVFVNLCTVYMMAGPVGPCS
jgi:hypothetical protein